MTAFGKLSGEYKFSLFQGAPVTFAGQHMVNLMLGLVMLSLVFRFTGNRTTFFVMLAIAFVMGVLIIIPIGGADMSVVVSMLNSYSGCEGAGIGFSLNNSMLIIAGSLVGSSGAIFSYIMCKAMNRSFFSVILGGFGGEATTAASGSKEQRPVKSGSADDAVFILGNPETVIIVPGYGLAVARTQRSAKELAAELTERGINMKYAIHSVAGRMPGCMNVLLAEAEVPYDQVHEMEDTNAEFGQADVAIILGANDVVNPAAHVKGSASCLFHGQNQPMTTTAILSALAEEQRGMVALLQRPHKATYASRDCWQGDLHGLPVVLALSKIGKIAAATAVTAMIEHFCVQRVVFTGVAGGLKQGVNVGDVVVGQSFVQHDMDASPLFPRYQVPLYGKIRFEGDAALTAALLHAGQAALADPNLRRTYPAAKAHIGLIASGDRFVSSAAESAALRSALLAVEMECAAVAQVCHGYNVPFAAVRTISDRADDTAHVDFPSFIDHVASQYALLIVE